MDTDFKISYVSPAVTRMQGWTPDEYMELTLEKLMTPVSLETVMDGYDRVKEAQLLGAGRYLKKPYTVENLGEAVRAELSR